MKTIIQLFIFQFILYGSYAQQISVTADKMNVFYIGVDNPITITVENTLCKDLIIQTDNGKVAGNGCQYSFWGNKTGVANIIILKKIKGKLTEIGRSTFRVKNIPPPTLKIGPYGSNFYNGIAKKVRKNEIAAQEYVRTELENFDFNVGFTVDSFYVTIVYADSCKSKTFFNTTNAINQSIHDAFAFLKPNDIIIFNRIYAKGPDDQEWKLDPLILTIDN